MQIDRTDEVRVVARVAALDIGKPGGWCVVCGCLGLPSGGRRRSGQCPRMAEQVCALGAWPAVSWVVGGGDQ